jgi:hypothetical protein
MSISGSRGRLRPPSCPLAAESANFPIILGNYQIYTLGECQLFRICIVQHNTAAIYHHAQLMLRGGVDYVDGFLQSTGHTGLQYCHRFMAANSVTWHTYSLPANGGSIATPLDSATHMCSRNGHARLTEDRALNCLAFVAFWRNQGELLGNDEQRSEGHNPE